MTEAKEQEKQQTTDHAERLAGVANALAGLPGVAEDVKSFSEKVNSDLAKLNISVETPAAETPIAGTPAETPAETPAKASAETPAETPSPEKTAAETPAPALELTNPLIDKSKLGKKPSAIEIKSFDELPAIIKNDFGMEVKEPKDMATYFSSVKKWRADAQKLSESERKVAEFSKLFELMPETLYDATMAFATGGNWEEIIVNKPKLDYNKKTEETDKKTLVKYYFPDKFKDEDFSDEQENPMKQALDIAYEASKKQFGLDKTTFETKRNSIADGAKRRLDGRKSSAAISVDSLKDSFPDITDDTKKEILGFLVSKDVNSLFFNSDGTYTKDAAKNYVLINHGFEAIEQLTRAAARAAETKAVEDILERGDDKLKSGKGANVKDKPNLALTKKLKEIEDVAKQEKKVF